MSNFNSTEKGSLIGQHIGRWTVTERVPDPKGRWRVLYRCVCDCGTERVLFKTNLVRGSSKSCGCLHSELQRARHQHYPDRYPNEYSVWASVRNRCNNPNYSEYFRYGGAGITIDPVWNDFAQFLADVGPRPSLDHTLDRSDNERGYTPGNVRWATKVEQANNTRRNHHLTLGDRTETVANWSRITGIASGTIFRRIYKGWSVERALTESVSKDPLNR
jgi:hypothetical protein